MGFLQAHRYSTQYCLEIESVDKPSGYYFSNSCTWKYEGIRNCEESEILPYLQAIKLVSWMLTDSWTRDIEHLSTCSDS